MVKVVPVPLIISISSLLHLLNLHGSQATTATTTTATNDVIYEYKRYNHVNTRKRKTLRYNSPISAAIVQSKQQHHQSDISLSSLPSPQQHHSEPQRMNLKRQMKNENTDKNKENKGDKENKEKENNKDDKDKNAGGGNNNKNKKTTSPRPTTQTPTYHPTTPRPTIKFGNPTPAPTTWTESWVDSSLTLSLSTMTADEDQLEFVTKETKSALPETRRRNAESSSFRRIYLSDVLDGNEQEFVEDVLTSVADLLCKYTNFVILAEEKSSSNKDGGGYNYVDYCENNNEIIDVHSYYTKRQTVIIVPIDGNDLSSLNLMDFQVFEESIQGRYLHWIQWEIKCPIVQISRTTLNEENQNAANALINVKSEARLVIGTTTNNDEMSTILMNKNSNALAVAADGWEVVQSIEFMKPRKAARDNGEQTGNGLNRNENLDESFRFAQPIRIAGIVMMVAFFVVLTILIRTGKRRDDKVWEARMAEPINGDLVTHEGVNVMLETSNLADSSRFSTEQELQQEGSNNVIESQRFIQTQSSSGSSQQEITRGRSSEIGTSFLPEMSTTTEVVETIERGSIFQRKRSSLTHLSVTPTEVETTSIFHERKNTNPTWGLR